MKKRWLSLLMLFCFSLGFVSGCKDDSAGPVNKLNIDGSDVVLKIGDDIYTAEELYGDMLNSVAGADVAYEKILRMVVESTVPVDANMTASWELMLDAFEEEVKTTALSSGVSEDDARKQLLTEDGYSSIDEMKEEYLYEVRLSKLQDNYWKEKKMDYYNDYFENRLPYYVKHALVKTSYTSARGAYATTIDSSDALALYNIYNWLVKGYDFSQIMNEYSEDTGSADSGVGYHMDLTTSFVSEFLHGVFVFDALLKGEEEAIGITESADFYASTALNGEGYNFGVINASDIVVLGDEATDTDTKSITMYENVKNDKDEIEEKNKTTISTAYGSYALYTRSIIFNQTFNNPGISVIAYDLGDDKAENTTVININGVEKEVLTDEKGNIVFVVCAKGSSSDLWIHFLTVNVSPFDENAKLFFSIDEKTTIDEMVAAKKAALETEDKTEEEVNEIIGEYKKDLEKYKTYVDEKVKNDDTVVNRNKIIEELEGYVETYAKRGITSGAVSGQDQFLTYDMVEYYMEKGEITIVNEEIKILVEKYITAQKTLIDFSSMNAIVNGWNEYYDLISLANSDEIISKKIPMECSYAVNGNSNRGALCKYNFETGFEINMRYMDGSTEMTVEDKYKSYHIGDSSFTLPTPEKAGYVFGGWYTTSDFKEGTEASIDTSKTSTNNKTELYVKWIEEAVEGGNN